MARMEKGGYIQVSMRFRAFVLAQSVEIFTDELFVIIEERAPLFGGVALEWSMDLMHATQKQSAK